MSKTKKTYEKVAATSKAKADKYFAKGCAAAKAGDADLANQLHAAAQSCYATSAKAEAAGKKRKK